MARPLKHGLDYFPLDVNLDIKIQLIEAEFGLTGFAVVVKLFQKIYGECGYYCEWTNEVALLFSRQLGLGGNVVSEIITATIKRGIFDKDKFDKYAILTSSGIQKRYFEAVNRRKQIEVKNEYLLINCTHYGINVDNNGVNVNNNSLKINNNSQSKEKESKLNKSKENSNIDPAEVIGLFKKICVSFPKPVLYRRLAKAISSCEVKDFKRLFEKSEQSDFLSGRDGKWCCDMEWVINHAGKIMSGAYDNRKSLVKNTNSSYDIEELERIV